MNHHITLLINPIYNVFNKWSSYLLPLVIRNSLSQNTSYSFFWTVRNRKLFLKLDKNMLCHNFQVLSSFCPLEQNRAIQLPFLLERSFQVNHVFFWRLTFLVVLSFLYPASPGYPLSNQWFTLIPLNVLLNWNTCSI